MEDVLPSWHARRPDSTPESESWTGRVGPGDSDVFARPSSLPYPLSALFSLVEAQREPFLACRDLAALLKGLPSRSAAALLLKDALQSRFPRVWKERFLFILLAAAPSDAQAADYALQFRHLKRLLARVERRAPLRPEETGLAREIISALALSRRADFEPFCRGAEAAFQGLREGRAAVSGDLGLLIYLLRSECSALAGHKRGLEESVSGDPAAVARLTPRLELLEDRLASMQGLVRRLGAFEPVMDLPMELEAAMGTAFEGFLAGLGLPGLEGLQAALRNQRAKRVPPKELIALSSLCRWVAEARGAAPEPLEWVRTALHAYDRGRFRVEASGAFPAVHALLAEAPAQADGAMLSGDFGEHPFSSWIARDGMTRPYRSANPDRLAPDLRSLASSNIHRDAVILKLLDHGAVRRTAGLVESIVKESRSPAVHAKIAAHPELHSGPACAGVPMALLQSGVAIPAELSRALIHPALVPFSEMKTLYRNRESLRPEVAEGLRIFLGRTYAL